MAGDLRFPAILYVCPVLSAKSGNAGRMRPYGFSCPRRFQGGRVPLDVARVSLGLGWDIGLSMPLHVAR